MSNDNKGDTMLRDLKDDAFRTAAAAAGYEALSPEQAQALNPNRFDFVWSVDFTLAVAIPLKWWDDASYAAYQADCGDDY